MVDAGVTFFLNTDNWFFLVLCITFLFQGEKILRQIFGITSKAGTLTDLATSGMAAYGVARNLMNRMKKKDEGKQNEQEEDTEEDEEEENSSPSAPRPPVSPGAMQNMQAANNLGGPSYLAGAKNPQLASLQNAQKVVNDAANKKRNSTGRKIFAKVTNIAGGTMGGLMGATYGLAAGSPQKAVTYGLAGVAAGKTFASWASTPIVGVSNAYAGRKMKKLVRSGAMDESFKKAGIDLSSMEKDTADLIREALAQQASAATRRGEKVGEYKFQKSIMKGKK